MKVSAEREEQIKQDFRSWAVLRDMEAEERSATDVSGSQKRALKAIRNLHAIHP
jgi:hypothetical protein